MSDVKISQMPAAALPLTGAELVTLVQAGANVQTALTNITGTAETPTIETANFNAVGGGIYQVKTSIGAITATLPAAPGTWDTITVQDTDGDAVTNNITVALNGKQYNGSGANPKINIAFALIKMVYNGTQWVGTT
ncbi:VCBS domain-containing protein [Acidocella sp.]|jgi:VCBS repeat-containing protein|uniref:VCBS domain-containing protein n=1 Tax=Acidocella sp. TaxID=50710 RepID=UPI002F41311B